MPGGIGETRVCGPASAGPSGARTQGGRIAALFGRLRTQHREASAAAGRAWGFRQSLLMPFGAPALPLDEAGKYVAGAYIVFVVLLVVYVAIMAAKLQRIEREMSEIATIAEQRKEEKEEVSA
jgi:hypothetical protein